MKIENDEQLQEALDKIDILWRLQEEGKASLEQQNELNTLFDAAELYEIENDWFGDE